MKAHADKQHDVLIENANVERTKDERSNTKRLRRKKRDRKFYIKGFVDGAKWWEWHTKGATMWPSDQTLALEEAKKRGV